MRRDSEPRLCLLQVDPVREHRRIDAVLEEHAPLLPYAASQALLVQLIRDAEHELIIRQAKPIDAMIKRPCAGDAPPVDRRDQPHPPEPPQQQAERVALVVMPMPDRNSFLTADLQ